jgi:septum formation protein
VTRSPPLLLASTSRHRRALLERLGLHFEVRSPQVPEDCVDGEPPAQRALRLALAKARAVAEHHPDALIIGSDQVACVGSVILDKPGNAERCREQLALLSGRSARFFTGCALIGPHHAEQMHTFDCAGGFKAESLGVALFERITSEDPTALIGLPLIWVAQALRSAGCQVP